MGHARLAMKEELEYFCDNVWVGVPMAEAQADYVGKMIGSRWMSCNKNDINDPDVRCRPAAQEPKTHADDSFHAANPPLKAKRLLFSQWSAEQSRNGSDMQSSFVDFEKAYVYGVPDRNLYVRLSAELGMPKNIMGKLVRCMHGTREGRCHLGDLLH